MKKILPGKGKLEGGKTFWVENSACSVVEIFAGRRRGAKIGTGRPWHSRDSYCSSTFAPTLTGPIPFAHKCWWSPEPQPPQVGRAAISGRVDSLVPLEALGDSPREVPESCSRRESSGKGLSEDFEDSADLRSVWFSPKEDWVRVGKWKIPWVNFRVLLMSAHGTHLGDSQNNCSSHLRENELPGVSLTVAKGRKMHCVLDKSSPLSQAYLL